MEVLRTKTAMLRTETVVFKIQAAEIRNETIPVRTDSLLVVCGYSESLYEQCNICAQAHVHSGAVSRTQPLVRRLATLAVRRLGMGGSGWAKWCPC